MSDRHDRIPETRAQSPTRLDADTWNRALDWLFELNAHPDDAELRAACDAWCREHPAHARAYAQAAAVWTAAGSAGGESRKRRRSRPRRAALAAATAVLFAVVLGPAAWRFWQADYRTAAGERLQVELADGSRMTLGSASAVRIDYGGRQRRLRLRSGRVYVEVHPDRTQPFEIAAARIRARALGTRYTVSKRGNGVEIAVAKGRVGVQRGDERLDLAAGEAALLDTGGAGVARWSLPPAEVAAWRHGQLVANQETVGEVLQRLDQAFPGTILVTDPDLSRRPISGVFRLDQPAAAARAVVAPHDGRVSTYPWLMVVGPR